MSINMLYYRIFILGREWKESDNTKMNKASRLSL